MTDATLLTYIGYLWMKHKDYGIALIPKYYYGINCKKEEQNFIIASWLIKEIENYYIDCSCLTEEEICDLIVKTQKLLN